MSGKKIVAAGVFLGALLRQGTAHLHRPVEPGG